MVDVEFIDCDQNSEEWYLARAGVITASNFAMVRERLKTGTSAGDYRLEAKKYAFRLAIERISGAPLDEVYSNGYMRRGNRLEDEARERHEVRIEQLIELCGFIRTTDRRFGASPDGLINHDGGCEYKCFLAPEKLMPILIDGDVSEIMDQMQGCMWLSGRSWWHFGLYCPALKNIGRELEIIPVERDDNYIAELEADLLEFDNLVEQYRSVLTEHHGPAIEVPEDPVIDHTEWPSAVGMFS